jgi:hypothetical protein
LTESGYAITINEEREKNYEIQKHLLLPVRDVDSCLLIVRRERHFKK